MTILLWFQIDFLKERGGKEFCQINFQTLTQFVENTNFEGVISTVNDIVDSGFWNTAFDVELVLRHASDCKKLQNSLADCLIQLHGPSPHFLIFFII